jgi:DNA-binding winged helix-turn-helix (wHTH) protein
LFYIFDNYTLDTDRRELRCGSSLSPIEPQVFDLLVYLICHHDRVVSRDELIGSIWGGRIVSESALSTRINAARSAVGDSGAEQRLIKTLPRKGVRFIGEIREQNEPPEAVRLEMIAEVPREVWAIDDDPAAAVMRIAPAHLARRFSVWRGYKGTLIVIGAFLLGLPIWSYFAHAERTKVDITTSAKQP